MSESRSFENFAAAVRRQWPETESDPIEDLLEQAENAHSPERGLVYAQIATVRAIQAQTEQLRIGNKLRVVLIEQLGEIAKTQTMPDYPFDPAVNVYRYLSADERKGLGL